MDFFLFRVLKLAFFSIICLELFFILEKKLKKLS